MPIDVDLAWAAGLLDGDGCISFHLFRSRGARPHFALILLLTNCDYSAVERVRTILGEGTVSKPSNPAPPRRSVYTWTAHNKGARRVLRMLMPYLHIKKEQARVALLMPLSGSNPHGAPMFERIAQAAIYSRVRELKHV